MIIEKAEKFRNEQGLYVFPFEVLDKTPGGSNLGRIEWRVELFKGRKKRGRYYIEKILVWATQTRDEKYLRKIFEIPCYSEAVVSSILGQRDSYSGYIWKISFCEDHGGVYFSAYPGNSHKELVINVGSSIGIDIDFK